MGLRLIPRLLERGHRITAVARRSSEARRPQGVEVVVDALDRSTWEARVRPFHTMVHLLGVAHPAPAMMAYLPVRAECEAAIRAANLNATILRPWYVLGPGHWWPLALLPFYKIAEAIPAAAQGATRLGLVRLEEMIAALLEAVENPVAGMKIVDVPGIRAAAKPR